MAKREIPLFICDISRKHRRGECDFIVCTDRDNGFVARAEAITGEIEEVGDDYRIGSPNNGYSLRISIVRMTGAKPDKSSVRTLLKKAMDYMQSLTALAVNVEAPTRKECAEYLTMLVRLNQHQLAEAKSNYEERQTTLTSMRMLVASAEYLSEDDTN